jgi:hypothetical protein
MRNSTPPVFVPSQVLVVADEADVRGAVFAALRLEGCSARTAETHALGAEEALVDRPGVIVFEYSLAWTDAHSIVEQMRLLMRPAPSLILLTDPETVASACASHGIPVFPMKAPANSNGPDVDDSSIVRHAKVLTVDCPDAAERFLATIAPVSMPSSGSIPPRPGLMVVRHARSGFRFRSSVMPPAAAANDR